MPCMDGGPAPERRSQAQRNQAGELDADQFEAILCGVFSELGDDLGEVLNEIRWGEVGVKRLFVDIWWEAHQEKDRVRRERENAIKQKLMDEELAELARLKAKYEGGS